MKNLNDLLDFYVNSLKATEESEGVKFVFAGKVRPAEFPLESYIVASSVARVSVENSDSAQRVRNVTLHFDAYGHNNASKRDLSFLCHRLADCLESIRSAYKVKAVEISEAVYESNLCVWRQQIRLKLHKTFVSEETDFRLIKDLCVISSATGFEEDCECSFYPVKEFLSGVTSYEDTGDVKGVLRVWINGEKDPFGAEEFELFEEQKGVFYKGCSVTGIKETDGICLYTIAYKAKNSYFGGKD